MEGNKLKKRINDISVRICRCAFTIMGWEFGKWIILILDNAPWQ